MRGTMRFSPGAKIASFYVFSRRYLSTVPSFSNCLLQPSTWHTPHSLRWGAFTTITLEMIYGSNAFGCTKRRTAGQTWRTLEPTCAVTHRAERRAVGSIDRRAEYRQNASLCGGVAEWLNALVLKT